MGIGQAWRLCPLPEILQFPSSFGGGASTARMMFSGVSRIGCGGGYQSLCQSKLKELYSSMSYLTTNPSVKPPTAGRTIK